LQLAVDLLAARFEGRATPPTEFVANCSLIVRQSA